MESRLVAEGVLGCPNCRDAFPVTEGFADLRAPPRGAPGPGLAGSPGGGPEGGERARRLVALLGIAGGAGVVALVGEPARLAPEVAAALPELLVVAVDADMRQWPETPQVTRLDAAPGLPFRDSSLRGGAVDGRLGAGWLAEAARVMQPRARLVVLHAPEDARGTLEACGFTVLAAEAETVVAARG